MLFMAKLEYTFKNDMLFKMLFVQYPDLLKRLVADLLNIAPEIIEQFEIKNPEIPPESLGDKFCRLDINMTVNEQRVDLEIQVRNEGDFPARTLFYWAREYSAALQAGGEYHELPRVVIISIVAFNVFDWEDYHAEFQPLEVTRHAPLTDKMSLHYFELPKLPEVVNADDNLKLWLSLFKAETEEELKEIEAWEVSVMQEAIGAYRSITATPEFREKERLYAKARHDEAQALYHARQEGEKAEREKWQGLVADKDAKLADKDAALADKDAALADKETKLAEQAALIAKLMA
jgi:predicted transposase/invertase (TIGR01784 family)